MQAQLNVLGGVSLQVGGRPVTHCGPVPLRLLALLALQGPLPRDVAADLLWDGTTPQSLQSLRTALSTLRRALRDAPDVLRVTGPTIGVNLRALQVDALQTPTGAQLLTWWTGPLLAGRTGATSRWLDWRAQTETRLLDQHVSALYDAAARDAHAQADAFVRRAQDLTRDALPARRSVNPGALLGRARELAALRATPGSVHVCGPRGSGRSSLVRAAYPDATWFTPGWQDRPDPEWAGRALRCGRAVFDNAETLPRWAWALAADLQARQCQVTLVSTGAVPTDWHDLPVVPTGPVPLDTLLRLAATLAPDCPAEELGPLMALTGGLPGRAARLLRGGGTTMRALLRARLAQFTEDALRVLWVSDVAVDRTGEWTDDEWTGDAADFASLRVRCSLQDQALRDALVTLSDAGLWADGRATHALAVEVAGELLPWWSRQILRPDAIRAS